MQLSIRISRRRTETPAQRGPTLKSQPKPGTEERDLYGGDAMDIRDYLYRGHVVCRRYLVVNCEVIQRSTCWVSQLTGSNRRVTADSKAEIESKIDELLESDL